MVYLLTLSFHYDYMLLNSIKISIGLITPLLRDVDKTGLMSINTQMKTLIAKSKEGKLLPEEYAVFPFYMNPY